MRSAIILVSVIIHHGLTKSIPEPMISLSLLFFAIFAFMDIQDFLKKHKDKFK